MGEYKALRVILIILDILALLAAIFFNLIAGHNNEDFTFADEFTIFKSTIGDVSDKYQIEVTPAGWTFIIWGVIYLYLLVIMLYCLTTLCRGDENGKLYYSPPFLSIDFYVFFFLNMGANVAWLFVWDREYMEATVPVLALTAGTLIVCIASVMRGIKTYGEELMQSGRKSEIGAVYGIVINGLAMYATWVSIATLLNLGIVLVSEAELEQRVASAIVLGCIAFDVVFYVCLDFAFLERYFRYVFTPYMVLIFSLIGILWRFKDDLERENAVFTVALLACGGFLFIAKIASAIVKDRKQNFYESLEAPEKIA